MSEIIKKFFWKIWIIVNHLTISDGSDGIAEVSTVNETARNEDISRRIVKERSELRYDTLLSILCQRDAVVREIVQEGRSVMDENVRISPRVKGRWQGQKPAPDYATHIATVDIVPTKLFRNTLKSVGFEVLGPKMGIAIISFVADTFTGLGDGSITPNEDIRITGEKIRVVDNGSSDPNVGIFFVGSDGVRHQVTRRLTENNPKSVIARVPALTAGEYTLELVTYFSSTSVALKNIRTLVYYLPLVVS